MGQRTLTFAFLMPDPNDHWVNRLTARVSRHPLCHVELFFETINQCFSIMWGECARFRFKNLSNPNYRLVSIAVSLKEYDACLEFCSSVARNSLGFDERGMWRTWVACPMCEVSSTLGGVTFCSKIITEAMQFAAIPEAGSLHASRTTPSTLYECVRFSPRIVCGSVPFKRNALMIHSQL